MSAPIPREDLRAAQLEAARLRKAIEIVIARENVAEWDIRVFLAAVLRDGA